MTSAGPTPLVERAPELALIDRAVASVAAGAGRMVVVSGVAGVGKTRLLDETARAAIERRFVVGRSTCRDGDLDRPAQPVIDALAAMPGVDEQLLADELDAFLVDDGHHPGAYSPGRFIPVLDRLVEEVERTATEAPAAIIVDDLQWADRATVRALAALANRGDQFPILIVGALRPLEPDHHHRELVDLVRRSGPNVDRIELEVLGRSGATHMARALLGGARLGTRLRKAIEDTGGSPLFVNELITAAAADGSIGIIDGDAELQTDGRPITFERLVLDRVRALGPATWDLLPVAAVLGVEFAPAELAELTQRPMHALWSDLRPAVEQGWLVEREANLRFRHDLVRDAVYYDIPLGVRRGLHAEAAATLAERNAPAPAIASHLVMAEAGIDDPTVDALIEAGRRLAIVEPRRALAYLHRCRDAVDPDDPRLVAVDGQIARAHVWAGDIDAARPAFEQVLATDLPAETREELEETFGEALFLHGRLDDAAERFTAVAERGASATSGLRRADLALTHVLSGRLDTADEHAALAVVEADANADARGGCEARSVRSLVAGLRCEHETARRLADEAVALADARPDRLGHRDLPLFFLGQVASFADDHETAVAALDRGIEVGRSIAMSWDLPILESARATEFVLSGDWDDAVAEAEAVLAYSAETGVRIVDAYAHACLAHVARRRGDVAAATDHIARGMDAVGTGSVQGSDLVFAEQAVTQLATGDIETGLATGLGLFRAVESLGVRGRLRSIGPPVAAAADRAGRHDDAASIRGTLMRLGDLPQASPGERAAAAIARAWLDTDPASAREAVRLLTSVRRRPESADAWTTVAIVTARAGGPEREVREAAEEATLRYDELGARWDLDQLQTSLEGLGFRPRRRRARARATHGWASLTDSERRVVDGVADGFRNAEIAGRLHVSRRTVESHLHHVYTKLGISSRVQLATQAQARRSMEDAEDQ
ncbi:MAG: AAA family ATPase [Actinomycetota bacterium]